MEHQFNEHVATYQIDQVRHTKKKRVVGDALVSHRSGRLVVSVFFFMHGLCFSSWASRIPTIQQYLHLSSSTLGAVLFALPAGFFLSLPLAGWLIPKIGSRRTVIGSACLYSIALLSIGASASIETLVVSLFSFGFFANLLNISINTQAVIVERLYAKKLMASFHGLWSLAGFTGAAVGAIMISNRVQPLIHYVFISVVFITATALCGKKLLRHDDNSQAKQTLFVLPDKSLIGLGIIAFCSMIAEGAMFDWSGIYFSRVVNVDAQLTGLGYTIFMIAMAGMRFFADGISARFGLVRILQISGVLTAAGLLVAVLFPNFIPALIGFFLIGMGVSSVVPMVYSAAGRSKTMSPGPALAAVSSLGFIGLLIGPPLIGFVAEATSLRISFLCIIPMAVSVVVLATLMRGKFAN